MGLGVASLAVLGLSILFALFFLYDQGWHVGGSTVKGIQYDAVHSMTIILEILLQDFHWELNP